MVCVLLSINGIRSSCSVPLNLSILFTDPGVLPGLLTPTFSLPACQILITGRNKRQVRISVKEARLGPLQNFYAD